MTNSTTLGVYLARETGHIIYDAWLKSPKRGFEVQENNLTPQELLENIAATPVYDDNGKPVMTMLESILLAIVQRAISGDNAAAFKIYDELQHKGVQKHAVAVAGNTLSPAAQAVLEHMGLIPTPPATIEAQPQPSLDDLFAAV